MRVGSLCTGIMGAEIAFSMMGLEPELVWYSEIDPHACSLLAAKTDAPNLGDLKLIDWAQVEPIDALVAGYPCQPFSTAGNRKGTDDPRHLWPWIADALRVLRPRYAFFENVAAHLGLGFDSVLRDLADIGFDAEWGTLRASDVGACHQRNRLFVVATLRGGVSLMPTPVVNDMGAGKTPDEWDALKEKWQAKFNNNGHGNSLSIEVAKLLPTPTKGDGNWGVTGGGSVNYGMTLTDVAKQTAGFPMYREIVNMLPTPREMTGGGDNTAGQDRPSGHKGTTNLHGLIQDEFGVPADVPEGIVSLLPTPVSRDSKGVTLHHKHRGVVSGLPDGTDWGKYAPAIERWAEVINRPAPGPTDDQKRLNPALVEWMMGYPEGWVDGISRTGQLKALGNSIVPHQAAAAWGHLLGLNVFAEAGGGASPADSLSIRRQRTRTSRDRRPGSQDSDLPMIPTPTAWLGRRPSQSIGSADRWHDKARSRELSDFIAALDGEG